MPIQIHILGKEKGGVTLCHACEYTGQLSNGVTAMCE